MDATRFLIGDTDPCEWLLQNAEINYVLAQYNQSPPNAAIPCVNAIIAKLTRLADESVGQVRIAYNQKAKAFRVLIQDLRNRIATGDIAPYAGGITRADVIAVSSNCAFTKPDFTKHMMTNRDEGGWTTNVDLGGWGWYW